ncbi:O-antigen ligase family protein [Patulibacter sp. NPDC049589]|uniref:O-antigen ligase family protein n=1 Tax=Patulibacter sp. NPDC049589 TaxID=3154731 RepID=UPI003412E975
MHAALRTLRAGRAARDLRPSAGGLLLTAALAVGTGVAFAGGGYGQTASAVAICLTALLSIAVGAMVAGGLGRMLPRRDAALGVLLLLAFAAWSLIATAWSVRPDRSIAWGALVAGYALTVFVAGAAARIAPSARAIAVGALIAGSVVLCGVAIVGRMSPDTAVTIGGLDNAIRLRGPLDYWNALGLVAAIGALAAARQAVEGDRPVAWRVAAGAVVPPLIATLLLSQSRGAIVALVVGIVVVAVSSGAARLRLPAMIALSTAAAAPLAITATGRVEGSAVVSTDGRAAVLGGIVAAIVLGGVIALAIRAAEERIAWDPRKTAGVLRAGTVVGLVALVIAAGAFVAKEGGPGTALTSLRDSVASVDEVAPVSGADRLLSVSSSNRTGWWAEAVGAWADRPLEGWGPSSFGTVRKDYRQDTTEVTQPHSLPLQVLAETGVIGFALLGGALWVLMRVGVRRLRRMREERIDPKQLALQATLLGAAAAWLVQSAIDWHFDLPGVTMPVLAGLAVAAAAPAPRRTPRTPDGTIAPATIDELDRQLDREERPAASGALVLGLTLAGALVLIVLTVSPVIGDRLASDAQARLAGGASAQGLKDATSDVALAANLDPFSLKPLEVGRRIAERRQNFLEARRLAIRETVRQPDNPEAWSALADVAGKIADRVGMRVAAKRAVALDPYGVKAVSQLADALGKRAPPEASPTAGATPFLDPPAAATTPVTPDGGGTTP